MRLPLIVLAAPIALALIACGGAGPHSADETGRPGQAATEVAPALPPEAVRALARYELQARGFVAALDDDATVPDEFEAHAEELVAIAEEVLPAFLELRPQCREYLLAAAALKQHWRSLGAEAIETGYHKDAALPTVAGDASGCYHMKDLIVHPISAQALLAEDAGNRTGARREIEEVLAHISVVRATR